MNSGYLRVTPLNAPTDCKGRVKVTAGRSSESAGTLRHASPHFLHSRLFLFLRCERDLRGRDAMKLWRVARLGHLSNRRVRMSTEPLIYSI